jgi:hypothetical protein
MCMSDTSHEKGGSMDAATALDVGAVRAQELLGGLLPPALVPLPHLLVSAECWEDERHVRLRGEAIYAIHRGGDAWWAVIVQESSSLPVGSVRLVSLPELRCESPSGRRGG